MALSRQKISVASVTPGATFTGYMTKCGGSIKTWHKRWFVLKGDQLHYFKSQKDEDVTGTIPLFEWSICKEEPDQKKKYCFSISSQKRTYVIQADTPELMRQWMQHINNTISGLKPRPKMMMPTSSAASKPTTGTSSPSSNYSAAGGGYGANNTASNTSNSSYGQQKAPTSTPSYAASSGPYDSGQSGGYAAAKAPVPSPAAGGPSPRQQLQAAKQAVSFLQDDDSKVLEFWQIWFESVPPREELTPNSGMGIDFTVSTSANMQKLTWRTGGPQNIFIQKMVDFFWNVGAPESEIDRLNDVGALINPFKIGSWIDMSAKGGMDGGWFFPVEISVKTASEAADPGDAVRCVLEWAEKHAVEKVYSVGRDMGAAPPRQTEFRVRLPGTDFERQLNIAVDAFEMFRFPPLPDEAMRVIRSQPRDGLCLSIITSSEGFVRLGLLTPRPSTDAVVKLCQLAHADHDELAKFEGSLGTDGAAYAEYQYLKEGFGYGVYNEGLDIVFHYMLGEETL